MTLIAEDLLLLLLDDETGRFKGVTQLRPVLGGALLAELAITGAAEVEAKEGWLHSPKVLVRGAEPDDPLLADALATVAEKPRTPQDLVTRLGKGLQEELLRRLVERGLLREERDRVLGLFPRTRWPAATVTHETEVRRAITATLAHGVTPEPRTASLIALLSAMGTAHRVLDADGLPARELRKRAKAVTEGDWAAQGVRDAVAATQAAVTAAVVAASTAATTSSS